MTVLEQLEAVPAGIQKTWFLRDHRQEIMRELALNGPPQRPPWDRAAQLRRWPWLSKGDGENPYPRVEGPPPIGASRSISKIEQLNTLNTHRERLEFLRANREAIRVERASLRGRPL